MVISVKPVQPEKALQPIEVTPLGIVVFWHPCINLFDKVSIIALQFCRLSYLLLASSTEILINPLHPLKTLLPIVETPLGMVIDIKPVQL